jgi:TyrR family helix-turn-helix protein
VRQLQNVVFRAITMSDQKVLDAGDLDWAEGSIANENVAAGFVDEAGESDTWEVLINQFESALLGKLYQDFPSSRKLAARLDTSHSMIAAKLRKHGIPVRK